LLLQPTFHSRVAPRRRVPFPRVRARMERSISWPPASALPTDEGRLRPNPPQAAIGPCLSTGEPGAAAATKRSIPAWPRAAAFHSRVSARVWNHPCSSTGLLPPAAEEGVNALGFLERGGAGQRENGTSLQPQRNRWNAVARGSARMERLVAAATSGSPVLKHGPSAACGGGGRKRPRLLERVARGQRENGTSLQQQRRVHPCSSTGLVPPAAEEGVNALGFWNVEAR
jgi:hypothetical protein